MCYDLDSIPTDVEQATGLEKKELDALMAGVEVMMNVLPCSKKSTSLFVNFVGSFQSWRQQRTMGHKNQAHYCPIIV